MYMCLSLLVSTEQTMETKIVVIITNLHCSHLKFVLYTNITERLQNALAVLSFLCCR